MIGLNFVYRPVGQAVIFLIISMVLVVAARVKNPETMWIIAGVCYGLFIVSNSVMVWKSATPWSYFLISLLLSVGYLFVAWGIMSIYASLLKISGSNESSMIFLIVMYHPFALLIVMFLKWLFLKLF
jgi:hypothetical protein